MVPVYSVKVGSGLFQECCRRDPAPTYGLDYRRKGGEGHWEYIETFSENTIEPIEAKAGNRRPVRGFTRRARRNMAQRANGHPVPFNAFQTLTYPDDVLWEPIGGYSMAWRAYEPEEMCVRGKNHLKELVRRVKREFPGAQMLWRMEITSRKFGEHAGHYAMHFHVLWALPFCNCELDFIPFARRVAQIWIAVIGTSHPDAYATHFEKVRKGKRAWEWLGSDSGKVLSYLLKYAAKSDEELFSFTTGRLWGVKGATKAEMLRTAELPLTEKEKLFLTRLLEERFIEKYNKAWSARIGQAPANRLESVLNDEAIRRERFETWIEKHLGLHWRTHFFMDRGELLDLIWLAKCQAESCPF